MTIRYEIHGEFSTVYCFYFESTEFGWLSIRCKVKGNKRVRPERLINYRSFKTSDILTSSGPSSSEGYVKINEERAKYLKDLIEDFTKLIKNLHEILDGGREKY